MATAESTRTPYDVLAAFVNAALDNGDVIPAREAERIAAEFARDYPREWAEYVAAESQRLIYDALRRSMDSRKQRARKHALPIAFGTAAESGDEDQLGLFKLWRCRVNDDNVQRPIGDMTGADHRYVAATYEASAQESQMLAAFHRALAKKCGSRTTSEVMDEAQFSRMYESITRK